MEKLIDCNELYKALAQWDWQDLYLPVHFKELVDELPAVDGGYTEQDMRASYNDGFSMGVRRGYEDAVRNYAKMALKQWIPVSERLPEKGGLYFVTKTRWGNTWCAAEYFLPESGWYGCIEPTAWMPLPEPWKGE